MIGREPKPHNDLFFVCGLIEHISRKTKNHCRVVVNAIGKEKLQKIYDLADVYHSENLDELTHKLIIEHNIEMGYFDNTINLEYKLPTHWEMGKVYRNLILDVCQDKQNKYIPTLISVYNSWITAKIDNYHSSMYYETPSYIYQSYLAGQPLP